MSINWFPGHMHKARKEIAKVIPKMDVVIEVLDARIPFSSENPLVDGLRKNTPVIKVLNKCDLADPHVTAQWLAHFSEQRQTKAIALTIEKPGTIKQLLKLCREAVPKRNLDHKPVSAMIMGIPNVGKSTLINTLAGRTIAKTGNEPAVTKAQQKINLPNNIYLFDTPGFLWPKLSPEDCGYRLAVTGAIKNTVFEYDDVALYAIEYLQNAYPNALLQTFNLDTLTEQPIDNLALIAGKRGCLKKGGHVDFHKVSEILLSQIKAGTLGKISFETPDMIPQESDEEEASNPS